MPRAERAAPSAAERHAQWQELFWDEPVRTSAPRAQALARQAELFGWLESETESKPVEASPVASRAERLSRPAPAAVRKVRMNSTPGYSERSRGMKREAVARLLQVTEGVNGLKGSPVVQLPRGRFRAQVDLWKGRPVGNPFVMGS